MNNYVQLKDSVVFATLSTAGEILESANIIKVDIDPELFVNKKYINGNFVDAPTIKYAIIDTNNNNTVIEIRKTLYESEIIGPIIENNDVQVLWTWDGENFNPPAIIEPTVTIVENIIIDSTETSTDIPLE